MNEHSFQKVFRSSHHFAFIYTFEFSIHMSFKSFNIDIYTSFVLPAVHDSIIYCLYFWFRVLKVIIPVYQFIQKVFLRFSTPCHRGPQVMISQTPVRCLCFEMVTDSSQSECPHGQGRLYFQFCLKRRDENFCRDPRRSCLIEHICYDFLL